MPDEDRALDVVRNSQDAELRRPSATCELVRCGAEIVELSERFNRGIFLGGLIFVGMASVAALAFLPLRQSDATYTTITVVVTALLAVAVPFAVARATALYRILRRRQTAQLCVVVLAALLVVHPLNSELWWPSCALVMLVATLVPLRRALMYCLLVLLANLAAHALAGDLDDVSAETIIGLWIGYVFWASAFAVFTERFAAFVVRLNTMSAAPRLPPRQVGSVQRSVVEQRDRVAPSPQRSSPGEEAVSRESAPGVLERLTARQLQVVALLADGLRYDEIAACLAISERQVQRHVSDATTRLGLRNANQLAAVAVAEGLVPVR